MTREQVEIAIVGGGPAGAVLAAWLAGAGHEVVVLERNPTWRWRAGGVFTSPAAVTGPLVSWLSKALVVRARSKATVSSRRPALS